MSGAEVEVAGGTYGGCRISLQLLEKKATAIYMTKRVRVSVCFYCRATMRLNAVRPEFPSLPDLGFVAHSDSSFSRSVASSRRHWKTISTHPRKPHGLQQAPVLLRRQRIVRIPQRTANGAGLLLSGWGSAGSCGGAGGRSCAFGWHF